MLRQSLRDISISLLTVTFIETYVIRENIIISVISFKYKHVVDTIVLSLKKKSYYNRAKKKYFFDNVSV